MIKKLDPENWGEVKKIIGAIVAISGIVSWFFPFYTWQIREVGYPITFYQAGYHLGNISFLLLGSFVAIFILFLCYQQKIAGVLSCLNILICLYYFTEFSNAALGIGYFGEVLMSILIFILSFFENKVKGIFIKET